MNVDAQPEVEPSRVLVVDDDENLRWVIARGLRHAGFEVEAASRVDEVRQLLRDDPRGYTAAILDLELGDGNGGELLWVLQEPDNACCAVVLSGYSLGPLVHQLRSRGAVRVLSKPVDIDELVAAVRRAEEATLAYREDLHTALDGDVVSLPAPAPVVEAALPAKAAAGPKLTPREADVLQLLRRGLSTKDMARELDLTARTIKFHVTNLLRKYDARSRIDLLARLSG